MRVRDDRERALEDLRKAYIARSGESLSLVFTRITYVAFSQRLKLVTNILFWIRFSSRAQRPTRDFSSEYKYRILRNKRLPSYKRPPFLL